MAFSLAHDAGRTGYRRWLMQVRLALLTKWAGLTGTDFQRRRDQSLFVSDGSNSNSFAPFSVPRSV